MREAGSGEGFGQWGNTDTLTGRGQGLNAEGELTVQEKSERITGGTGLRWFGTRGYLEKLMNFSQNNILKFMEENHKITKGNNYIEIL